jgi:NADH:ubiquinone oxidoreductase subunit E
MRKLEGKVEVKATFCLGNCSESVAVKVNDESIENVNSTTVNAFFNDRILPKISLMRKFVPVNK